MNNPQEVELEIKKKSQRVIKIAIVSAVVVIVDAGIAFGFGYVNYIWLVLNTVVALSIPICGYRGATNKNAKDLAWFTWCSLFKSVCMLIDVGYSIFLAMYVSDLLSYCDENYSADCSVYSSSFWIYFIIIMIIYVAYLITLCFSFWLGKQLYNHPYFTKIVVAPPVITTEAKPIEMIQIVTPDGQVVTGYHVPKTMQLPQNVNIIQGAVANPTPQATIPTVISTSPIPQASIPTTYLVNMNQQEQPNIMQGVVTNPTQQGTYIVNNNEEAAARGGIYIVNVDNNEQPMPKQREGIYIMNKNDDDGEEQNETNEVNIKNKPPPPPRRHVKKSKKESPQSSPKEEEEAYQLPSQSYKNEKQVKTNNSNDSSDSDY